MKKRALFLAVALSLAASAAFAEGEKYKDYTVTGPYTHKNLSVFLIHGQDALKGKNFMTLEEALDSKKLVIYETQNVNGLKVENKSRTEKVYIQAGDIIKGGQQDRVIQRDLILKPMSGKLDISVFCVESGRWEGRGQEASGVFSSSKNQLPSKELKIAAFAPPAQTNAAAVPAMDFAAGSQAQVWNQVDAAQEGLSANLGKNVKSKQSESSLLLTLEDKDLRKRAKEYADDINRQVKDDQDVVGYVFTINGAIDSGDIYGNRTLFTKLWHKLVDSSSTEAISKLNKKGKFAELQADDITKWLGDVENIKAVKKPVGKTLEAVERNSKDDFSVETYEKDEDGQFVHENVIKK